MPLTQFSDLFASIHEKAINNVVLQLQRQRPSLFNYGTQYFVAHPDRLCNRVIGFIDDDVPRFGNPIVHLEKLLSIPGYTGPLGMEYCLQLRELSIDFHPGNVHTLPAELNPPLAPQHFSLKGSVCVGLGCPDAAILGQLAPVEQPFFPVIDKNDFVEQPNKPPRENPNEPGKDDKPPAPPERPLPFRKPICFCLDLFAVLHLEREGGTIDPVIALKLDNLELVDLKPDSLESIVECFLKTMLMMSVLPKVKLALKALVFNIADVLTIEPTPSPGTVPFNPAVEDDQVKVFVSLTT